MISAREFFDNMSNEEKDAYISNYKKECQEIQSVLSSKSGEVLLNIIKRMAYLNVDILHENITSEQLFRTEGRRDIYHTLMSYKDNPCEQLVKNLEAVVYKNRNNGEIYE